MRTACPARPETLAARSKKSRRCRWRCQNSASGEGQPGVRGSPGPLRPGRRCRPRKRGHPRQMAADDGRNSAVYGRYGGPRHRLAPWPAAPTAVTIGDVWRRRPFKSGVLGDLAPSGLGCVGWDNACRRSRPFVSNSAEPRAAQQALQRPRPASQVLSILNHEIECAVLQLCVNRCPSHVTHSVLRHYGR
jgi:hypothetical protein